MKDESVTGAFFILSNLIDKNPELVLRMTEEGHLVCNHTSNHKDISMMSKDLMLENIRSLEEKYEESTGLKMEKIFRFPEGRYSENAILELEEAGYSTVFWSMAYDDWDNSRQPNREKAIAKLLSTTHEGAIVLLHPTSSTNAEILPYLIRSWKEQGYIFGSLKDLCK
jgi:peptidoglycan-N-acetylmuramic acid deacetylase